MTCLSFAIAVEAVALLSFKREVFWPYFAGTALLLIGLIAMPVERYRQARGMEKIIMFGPLFFAVPMGVFAGDHFVFPGVIAQMVPAWMPWHLFWVYFVGVALVAGGLGLASGKYSRLAGLMLGLMIFLFDLMIHIPNFIAHPGDRFALAIMLRELSFSCGALAFATTQPERSSSSQLQVLLVVLRCAIAVAAIVFGVEHVLHPNFVPVVPLRRQLPTWMPAHIVLSYMTGTILIFAGIALILNRKARSAATWLGAFAFAIVLLVYVPILLSNPADNVSLNYVADTLTYSGCVLLLAGALPSEEQRQSPAREHETTIAA